MQVGAVEDQASSEFRHLPLQLEVQRDHGPPGKKKAVNGDED
jgi:hypothetical protein